MKSKDLIKIRTNFNEILDTKLSNETITEALYYISKIAEYDDECAHIMEKNLWMSVLKILASDGSELARNALKTQDIGFSRWFA